MKRVIIVQARTTSTRLPGKVLMDLAGQPMLAQQIRRLKRCQHADEIVVATTTNPTDDPVVAVTEKENVRWFRGSEHDVLSRYVVAAQEAYADVVVRITADCPLIDPLQIDAVIQALIEHNHEYDYATNIRPRTFPRGLDVEVFFRDVIERAARLAISIPAREHVTYFINVERPDLFLLLPVCDSADNSDLRWTVDTEEDLNMVRRIYDELQLNCKFLPYYDILRYVRAHPEITAINAGVA